MSAIRLFPRSSVFRMATDVSLAVALLLGISLSGAHAQENAPQEKSPLTAADRSSATLLPSGAVGFAEINRAGAWIEQLRNSDYLRQLLETEQYRDLEKNPQFVKADAGRKIAEAQLGVDLWKAAAELLNGQVAVAAYPKPDGNPAVNAVLLLRGANPQFLANLRQRLEPFLTLGEAKAESSDLIPDTRIFSIVGQIFVAWGETWIAAASTRELLDQELSILAGKKQPVLNDDPPFQSMSAQMGEKHLLRGYVNTALLTKAKGSRLTPERLDNALVSMLFGGIIELAAATPYAGVAVDLSDRQLAVTASIAGDSRQVDEAHRVFFSDPTTPGTPDLPALPALISGFTFHLDVANWYKQREKLLEPRILPAFDQFETGISNLLPRQDVGEDVIPLLGRNLTFLAAPQNYSHLNGKPGLKLPGFAVIFDLTKAEEGGDLFQLFFQTLSAILNLNAGQQKNEPWIMRSETYRDVQISYGKYLKKPTGDQLPVVFNFMPCSAQVGNRFIISSSVETCRQIIDAVKSPGNEAARPNRNLDFLLKIGPLADVLQSNRDVFIARAIQQGADTKQAEVNVDALFQLLRHFESLRLSSHVLSDAFQVKFEANWK